MKTIIITTVLAVICVAGMALSVAAYLKASLLSAYTCVHVDALPYIAVGLACFIGLLASVHYFNENQ